MKVESLAVMTALNVDTVSAFDILGAEQDVRDYSAANWFLNSVAVQSVDVLTNNTGKVAALKASCVSVRRIPLVSPRMSKHAKRQMDAKVARLNHTLEEY
jgi:GTP cyclohydrolase II